VEVPLTTVFIGVMQYRSLRCVKLVTATDLAFLRSLGRSAVLGDQAVQDLPALDPGGDVDGLAGLPLRGLLL
jgi:hypothetical protein